MNEIPAVRIIAHIQTDFDEKFGIPRQSGLADKLIAKIIMEPSYRDMDAFRGLEAYSHIWLLWQFSQALRQQWSPTVRPPRLGGNRRLGVFATRSPYRPSPIGLSCVRLEQILCDAQLGPVLIVTGADLLNGTPIYDIKPYLSYADAHPDARDALAGSRKDAVLSVHIAPQWLACVPEASREGLLQVLAQDPRPGYQHEPNRVYKMAFAGLDVHFTIDAYGVTVINIAQFKG